MRADRTMIQRARGAGLLDRLRIKIGLPLEFYLQAVQPVIEAYAAHVYVISQPTCNHVAQSGCLLMDGLELAGIALDLRRGRILPPNAATEDIGERAHRWTYAVFVAALLHPALASRTGIQPGGLLPVHTAVDVMNERDKGAAGQVHGRSAHPLLIFRSMVPEAIQNWLSADIALLGELHAFLLGEETVQKGAIALLVRQSLSEYERKRGEAPATSIAVRGNGISLPTVDGEDIKDVPEASAMGSVRSVSEAGAAKRFMDWVTGGIRDGSIRINEAIAPVHFVKEGMLLVSPRIFRDFALRHGEDGNGTGLNGNVDESWVGKAIQRQVLRAGWHRKTGHGSNIQRYDIVRNGRVVSALSGVLITKPERFISPLPAVNPLLICSVLA